MTVHIAGDERSNAPGVAVFHPWWGLNDDVRAFADRLAAEGFFVLAPDLFDGQIATTIEDAERLSGSADDATCESIVLATIDRLAAREHAPRAIGTVGFSFGAAWSIWASAQRESIAATVVYYGTWVGDILGEARTPVLGHFAADDPYEDAETVDAFERLLREAGREASIQRYPDTGHWFAEPSRDAYRSDAAEVAFARTVQFLRGRLAE
jgi:carboxymethylenebutenolidase